MYSVQRFWSLREPWLVQTVWRCEIYSTQTLWDSGSVPLLGSLFRPMPRLNSVLILCFLKVPGFWWCSAFSGHFLWAPQPNRHFVAICPILIGHSQPRPQVVVHAPWCVRILRILAVRFLCFQLLLKGLKEGAVPERREHASHLSGSGPFLGFAPVSSLAHIQKISSQNLSRLCTSPF